jgi:aryl-alcohol dehydrogenase-like predicted oxidoreductase
LEKRRLGRTDIEVTPIGLGVMQFSGGKGLFGMGMQKLSGEQMNAIVKAALDGGINWFDTAELYGRGHSEQALANGLKAAGKQAGDVHIATKWLPLLRTAGNIPRTIDRRLHFLDGYSIALYQVHLPWSFSSPEAEMAAMAGLVEAGKIRSVGVSNFSAGQMRRAQAALEKRGLTLAANQVHYSLLQRGIERDGVLDTAKELGVTIIAYTPLETGLLTGFYHKDPALLKQKPLFRRRSMRRQIESSRHLVEALEEIATRYEATAVQVALNWLIHFHGQTVVAIPGASKVTQAEQAAGAMAFKLTAEELAWLDELSRPFPD